MSLFNEETIVDAQKYLINAKASIQKNGRLGFTNEAATLLSLSSGKTMLFSICRNGDLAAVVCDYSEARGFKIQQGGNYFYIRMKSFFDSQDLDYVSQRVTYDIVETSEQYHEKMVYKFKRGIYPRNLNNNQNVEDDSFSVEKNQEDCLCEHENE